MNKKQLYFIVFCIIIISSFSIYITSNTKSKQLNYIFSRRITITNESIDPLYLSENYTTFSLLMNSSWQMTNLINASSMFKLETDEDSNQNIIFITDSLQPGENISLSYSIQIEQIKRLHPTISISKSGQLSDIPFTIKERYCQQSETFSTKDVEVERLTYQVWNKTGMSENVLEIVCELANWIGINVKSKTMDVPRYPSETLKLRRGDCDDKSNLLITMSRILGIPSFLQVGCIYGPSRTETAWENHLTSIYNSVSFHAWAIIYIPPWGWLPFDMTLGWNKDNCINGITSAPIYSTNTFQLLNITSIDWVGDSRRFKQQVIDSPLYFQDEVTMIHTPITDHLQKIKSFIERIIGVKFIQIMRKKELNQYFIKLLNLSVVSNNFNS